MIIANISWYLQRAPRPPKKKHAHTQRLISVTCTTSVIPASSWLSAYLEKNTFGLYTQKKHFAKIIQPTSSMKVIYPHSWFHYISYLWWLMDISISNSKTDIDTSVKNNKNKWLLNIDICDHLGISPQYPRMRGLQGSWRQRKSWCWRKGARSGSCQ